MTQETNGLICEMRNDIINYVQDVAVHSLADRQCFGYTCCLFVQGRRCNDSCMFPRDVFTIYLITYSIEQSPS